MHDEPGARPTGILAQTPTIDTHGFAILDRLRSRFRSVSSNLMDCATLLAHPDQLVREDKSTSAPLPHLTSEDQYLYGDLVEDSFGAAVRLEQERVRFGLAHKALDRWTGASETPSAGVTPP